MSSNAKGGVEQVPPDHLKWLGRNKGDFVKPEKKAETWVDRMKPSGLSKGNVGAAEQRYVPRLYHGGDESSSVFSKAKTNPLVPMGMLATVGALVLGLRAMINRDKRQSQLMMRYRVGFQFMTIIAIVGGLAVSSYSTKPE